MPGNYSDADSFLRLCDLLGRAGLWYPHDSPDSSLSFCEAFLAACRIQGVNESVLKDLVSSLQNANSEPEAHWQAYRRTLALDALLAHPDVLKQLWKSTGLVQIGVTAERPHDPEPQSFLQRDGRPLLHLPVLKRMFMFGASPHSLGPTEVAGYDWTALLSCYTLDEQRSFSPDLHSHADTTRDKAEFWRAVCQQSPAFWARESCSDRCRCFALEPEDAPEAAPAGADPAELLLRSAEHWRWTQEHLHRLGAQEGTDEACAWCEQPLLAEGQNRESFDFDDTGWMGDRGGWYSSRPADPALRPAARPRPRSHRASRLRRQGRPRAQRGRATTTHARHRPAASFGFIRPTCALYRRKRWIESVLQKAVSPPHERDHRSIALSYSELSLGALVVPEGEITTLLAAKLWRRGAPQGFLGTEQTLKNARRVRRACGRRSAPTLCQVWRILDARTGCPETDWELCVRLAEFGVTMPGLREHNPSNASSPIWRLEAWLLWLQWLIGEEGSLADLEQHWRVSDPDELARWLTSQLRGLRRLGDQVPSATSIAAWLYLCADTLFGHGENSKPLLQVVKPRSTLAYVERLRAWTNKDLQLFAFRLSPSRGEPRAASDDKDGRVCVFAGATLHPMQDVVHVEDLFPSSDAMAMALRRVRLFARSALLGPIWGETAQARVQAEGAAREEATRRVAGAGIVHNLKNLVLGIIGPADAALDRLRTAVPNLETLLAGAADEGAGAARRVLALNNEAVERLESGSAMASYIRSGIAEYHAFLSGGTRGGGQAERGAAPLQDVLRRAFNTTCGMLAWDPALFSDCGFGSFARNRGQRMKDLEQACTSVQTAARTAPDSADLRIESVFRLRADLEEELGKQRVPHAPLIEHVLIELLYNAVRHYPRWSQWAEFSGETKTEYSILATCEDRHDGAAVLKVTNTVIPNDGKDLIEEMNGESHPGSGSVGGRQAVRSLAKALGWTLRCHLEEQERLLVVECAIPLERSEDH